MATQLAKQGVSISSDQLGKLVAMSVVEVPISQMAVVIGIEEKDIDAIKLTSEYIEAMAGKAGEDFEKSTTLNDGWDRIEAIAINKDLR